MASATSDAGSGMQQPLFELRGIRKSFGRHAVLRDLSLKLNGGDFTLLLGANGTGKTTLLRLCAGLYHPDGGSILFDGQACDPIKAQGMAHCGHSLFLYANLTVAENLELFARLAGLNIDLEEQLSEWRLTGQSGRKVFELSKGTQFRVSLCRAFLTAPRFLFLDEPTSALDEQALDLLVRKAQVVTAERRGIVLVATHDVRRLRGVANRVVLLQHGAIAQDVAELRAHAPGSGLEELKENVIQRYFEANC